MVRVESDERPERPLELVVLSTWGERLRGLLGTGPDARAVMLGEVLLVRREVPPREVVSHPEACCAIERPASGGPWPEEGEHLWVSALSVGTSVL